MKNKHSFLFAIVTIAALTTSTLRAADRKDIVDTAVAAGSFKTLAAALGAADLVGALKSEGPFTVFAPTDEAFAKLPKGTVASLLKSENKAKLAAILNYHVVQGRVYSDQALAAKNAKTLQGNSVRITHSRDGVKINEANLVAADIDASNGVIHVIDGVLLPPMNQISAAEARDMIRNAVSEGVPLFNSGHHGACAEIYMTTMMKMLEYGDQMPEQIVANMKHVVDRAKHTSCPTRRAWTLRHGLDHAYARMANLE